MDHWTISITGISLNIPDGEFISFNISKIRNPVSITSIGVYIIDSIGNVVTYNPALTTSSPTSLASNLVIKSVNYTNSNLRNSANYTIQAYLTPNDGDYIIIQFPIQYLLLRDNSNSIECGAISTN